MRAETWEVTVSVNGESILTIGSSHLSGVDNIDDYADRIRDCALHLRSFIGDEASFQSGSAGDVELLKGFKPPFRQILDCIVDSSDRKVCAALFGDDHDARTTLMGRVTELLNYAAATTHAKAAGGWRLVPVDPTVEMLTAGAAASVDTVRSPRGTWQAMLAASPSHDGERQPEGGA